jgi:hypothetical protein
MSDTFPGEQLIRRCHSDGPWPKNDMKDNNEDDGGKGAGVDGRHGNWGDGERRAMKVPVSSGTRLSMKRRD